MLNWIKAAGFVPSDPELFEELIHTFSLAMAQSSTLSASLATFFQAKRRESVLSHFPPHIGDHFKSQLAASSFAGPHLFEDAVLKRVASESREDSAVASNVALTKAVSLPIFGAGRAARKASSEQSSASAPSTSSYRGRGRGSLPVFRGRGQGQKRKAGSDSQLSLIHI